MTATVIAFPDKGGRPSNEVAALRERCDDLTGRPAALRHRDGAHPPRGRRRAMNRYPDERPRTGCAAVVGMAAAAGVVISVVWLLAPFVAQALRDGGL